MGTLQDCHLLADPLRGVNAIGPVVGQPMPNALRPIAPACVLGDENIRRAVVALFENGGRQLRIPLEAGYDGDEMDE